MWGSSGAADVPVIIDDGAGHTLHDLFELVLNAYPVNIFLDHDMNIINITESEMNPTAVNDVIQGMVDNIPITICNDPIAINYNNNAICDYTNVFTDYETDIQPIFDNNCTQCHGSSGGLSLANYTNLMSSSVVTLNNGGASTIYSRMTSSTNSMPPTGLIDSYLAERIKAWIDQGAPECAQGEDCAGVCGGDSIEDMCNVCDSESSNDCIQDCNGEWGGSLVNDQCGVCGGDNSTCTDCNEVVNGSAITDGCGDCVDGNTGLESCPTDCNDVDGGTAWENSCGECVAEGDISCVQGCDGNWSNNGSQLLDDECGVCGDNNSTCLDCAGVPNGTSYIDECSICGGDGTSCLSIQNSISDNFSINNIYPNPFNPVVNINYSLSISDIVEINIYDLNGQIVEALFSGYKPIGNYEISWDASNMSSGIYIIMISSGSAILSNQLILLK